MRPTNDPFRVLIVTQAVDTQNPVLGFFHDWIQAFAESVAFDQVSVIALEHGTSTLPNNVHIYSLGKEYGQTSRVKYALNFLRLIWQLRRKYDAVLVHMNQEYILLGGLFWRLSGKKIFFWRNHYQGDWKTDVALALCNETYYTSRHSYNASSKKSRRMPVGVNTEDFYTTDQVPVPNSILSLGRISPSKNLELLIGALGGLKKKGISLTVSFYGGGEPEYVKKLITYAKTQTVDATFFGPVFKHKAPDIYRRHHIFVNTSRSGMLDKTIFEAMACGTLTLTCNRDLHELLPKELYFEEMDALGLMQGLEKLLNLTTEEEHNIIKQQKELAEKESLHMLAQVLTERMRTYIK